MQNPNSLIDTGQAIIADGLSCEAPLSGLKQKKK